MSILTCALDTPDFREFLVSVGIKNPIVLPCFSCCQPVLTTTPPPEGATISCSPCAVRLSVVDAHVTIAPPDPAAVEEASKLLGEDPREMFGHLLTRWLVMQLEIESERARLAKEKE